MYAGFRPLRRIGLTLQLACFLSFAHVIRSSIRALADKRLAVTPMRVIRPLSPPLRSVGCLARVLVSLTHLPPSPSAPHPRARPNSGAPINARRAQPDAQPDAKRHRHQGETLRSHSCRRAPFLSHHAQDYCNLLLRLLRPAAVLAGWVSVDLRGVFSHVGECVCCNAATSGVMVCVLQRTQLAQ
jgi:hypothetical protein